MMNVEVIVLSGVLYPSLIRSRIRSLLTKISPEDLEGLEKVVVTQARGVKKRMRSGGEYSRAERTITLYINQILSGKYYLILFPFLGTLTLAMILYHEIGHHVIAKRHSISKKEHEKYANYYARKSMQELFPLMRIVLSPLKPIVAYAVKRIK